MGKIKYVLYPKKNPITKEFGYMAVKFSTGANTIDTNTMFAAMAEHGHIPPAQIPGAFSAIMKAINTFCLNGHSVTIPELGTFRVTLRSKGAVSEEDFTTEYIRGLNIQFIPNSRLKYELLSNTNFVRAVPE